MLKLYHLVNIDTGEIVYSTEDENKVYRRFHILNIPSYKFDGTFRFYIFTQLVNRKDYVCFLRMNCDDMKNGSKIG